MKKSSNILFSNIDNSQLETLMHTVNETLATGSNFQNTKSFTTADLWNIQRQAKIRVQRRYSL